MGYKLYEVRCVNCRNKEDFLGTEEELQMGAQCTLCGGKSYWTPSAVAISTSDSASFLDGTKRKGFDELKQVAKLKVAAMDLPQGERKEIKKEIKKLGGDTNGV